MRHHAEIINSHQRSVEPPLQLVQSTGQWGGRTPKVAGRALDGRLWDEMPAAGQPRQSYGSGQQQEDADADARAD